MNSLDGYEMIMTKIYLKRNMETIIFIMNLNFNHTDIKNTYFIESAIDPWHIQ